MDHGQWVEFAYNSLAMIIACVKITFECSAQVLVWHRNSP